MDESVAIDLQDRLCRGEPRASTLLYLEIRRMAAEILKHSYNVDGRLDEFSHDVAANLIAQYLKHPGYRIRKFSKRVSIECLGVVAERELNPNTNGGNGSEHTKIAKKTLPLNDSIATVVNEPVEEDPILVANLTNLFSCYKYFAPAIKQLRPHVNDSWLRSNIRLLHNVFQDTRGIGSLPVGSFNLGSI